jgi:hypothetical protein
MMKFRFKADQTGACPETMCQEKTMEITIDKKIPMPNERTNGLWRSVLVKMKKGHSILVNDERERSAIWHSAKRLDVKLISRAEGDKIRVWRASA